MSNSHDLLFQFEIGAVVVIAVAVGMITTFLYRKYIVWLANMLVRPFYLYQLRRQGIKEWTLRSHSKEYLQEYHHRRATFHDDRNRIARIGDMANLEADRIVYMVYRILVTLGVEREENAYTGTGGGSRADRGRVRATARVASHR